MIRHIEPGSWKVINNTKFNNLEEDHFRRTSLHLSFTKFYRPLDFSCRGGQDIRVGLLECFISVHDAGKWVADVDVLAAIEPLNRVILRLKDKIRFTSAAAMKPVNKMVRIDDIRLDRPKCACGGTFSNEVVSIEGWDEILDMPGAIAVIRARGNPLARLAIFSVLSQLRITDIDSESDTYSDIKDYRKVILCPPKGKICLPCLSKVMKLEGRVLIY